MLPIGRKQAVRVNITACFAIGLGAALPWGISVDLFYAYIHFLGQQSENPEKLEASYDGSLHMIGVGLRYAR